MDMDTAYLVLKEDFDGDITVLDIFSNRDNAEELTSLLSKTVNKKDDYAPRYRVSVRDIKGGFDHAHIPKEEALILITNSLSENTSNNTLYSILDILGCSKVRIID